MKNPIIHHHSLLSRAAMAGLVLAAAPLHADTLLFLDTFNRPNSTDLNASTDGKSGSLGALTWTAITALNSPTGNIVDINGNSLRIDATGSSGADGGIAYISNHNFTDAAIKSAGTFKVSVDIVSTSSAGDGRVIGFGVGSSLAELAAVTSASPIFKPSDVYFIYDNVGASRGLRVYHNGVAQSADLLPFPSGTPSPPDTLSGTFTFTDMDVGTTLNYELFIDGISVVTGSTVWSGTDENYLSLASNYTNASLFDNFSVTVPGPPVLLATNPADNATGVAPDSNLVATFDEPVFLNTTGSITIKNLTTATATVIVLPGPDANGTLLVNGNQLTIDPTAVLGVPGDQIAIEISADAIKDADDTFYAGILSTDDPNWSFTIDNIPPAPIYFHPISGSDRAPLNGALFIAFNEAPTIGSGNLVIYRADDTPVETIDVTSLTVNGNRVAITPTVPLAHNTSYYVLIDTGAFTDDLGNGYGITDPAVWTFTTISNDPTVLFGDSFNRPNDTDLNASAGKYGSLGALTYTSVIIDDPEQTGVANVQLSDGQLLLESNENNGNSGAVVYPNHNFVDAVIASTGGFSTTVDLNANLSGGTGRYLSVAVGRASADIDGQTSVTAAGNAATADLVVALRNNDTLWIYENGTNVTGTGLTGAPATPTKMRIDYSLADFNLGSTVNYSVFFNDSVTAFASGSFTWSGTNENYISLSSNLLLTVAVGERHAMLDNLQIRTLGETPTSGYDTWKSQITNGLDGRTQDADGDGFTNLEEFLFGTSPIAGNGSLVSSTPGSGNLTLRWLQREGGGASYTLKQSATLEAGSWTPVVSPAPALDANQSGAPVDYDYFTVILPTSGGKLFFRIEGVEN